MSQKYQLRLWFIGLSSAFLVLVAPTMTELSGSKLLAQNVVSQNLEAASYFQQGVMRYHHQDLSGAESA
ncbi:hypothetical protein CBP16_02630, partial [Fischerella thermalis WC217]